MAAAPLLVLTPTLGASPYLDEVVGDVARLAQSIPLTHVLIAPPDAVGALRVRWSSVTVIAETSRGGMYAALNAGAAAVPGWRWCTYINDDDRLFPGFGDLWRAAETSVASVVYGEVDYLAHDGTKLARFPLCRNPRDVAPLLAGGIAPFTQQGTVVRAELWERLGGFNASLRLAADFDFWVRAAREGASFSRQRARVAGFRLRAGQLSADLARVKTEMDSSLHRAALPFGAVRRGWALVRFRALNAPRIVARIARTGRARSRHLLGSGE